MTSLTISKGSIDQFFVVVIGLERYDVSFESLKQVPLLDTLITALDSDSNANKIDIPLVPQKFMKKILQCLSDCTHLHQILLSLSESSIHNENPYTLIQIIHYCDYLGISREHMTALIKPTQINDYKIIYNCVFNDETNTVDDVCIGVTVSPETGQRISINMQTDEFIEIAKTERTLVDVTQYIRQKCTFKNNQQTMVYYLEGVNINHPNNSASNIYIPSDQIVLYGTLIFLKLQYLFDLDMREIGLSDSFLNMVLHVY